MQTVTELPDSSLVTLAAGRDAAASAELIRRYEPRLRDLVRALDGAAEHDDVVQEVWALAFGDLDSLRDVHSFWPWLKQITRRTVYRTTKAARREHARGDVAAALPAAAGVDEVVLRADEHRRAWLAFGALGGRNAEILRLRVIEERSSQEVADELGWSAKAVYTGMQRSRAAIRAAHDRVKVLIPPSLLGGLRRWRQFFEVSPEAAAVVIVAIGLGAAPSVVPALTSVSLTEREPVVQQAPGGSSIGDEDDLNLRPLDTAAHGSAPRDTPERNDGGRDDTNTPTARAELARIPGVDQKITTYDDAFDEDAEEEPDVRIGNDDDVAVRLWPSHHVPGGSPVQPEPIVLDPTGDAPA